MERGQEEQVPGLLQPPEVYRCCQFLQERQLDHHGEGCRSRLSFRYYNSGRFQVSDQRPPFQTPNRESAIVVTHPRRLHRAHLLRRILLGAMGRQRVRRPRPRYLPSIQEPSSRQAVCSQHIVRTRGILPAETRYLAAIHEYVLGFQDHHSSSRRRKTTEDPQRTPPTIADLLQPRLNRALQEQDLNERNSECNYWVREDDSVLQPPE
mmetsp:Transcript_31756/g.48707  ORF Transcript_31756/g.48707 Transcript_31756/m.48707 type:complete len:208 (+) Transcript_31756:210-833(+)